MTSINASTTMKVKKKKNPTPAVRSGNSMNGLISSGGNRGSRPGGRSSTSSTIKKSPNRKLSPPRGKMGATKGRGSAPNLVAKSLGSPQQINALTSLSEDEQREEVRNFVLSAFGEKSFREKGSKPHTASSTRDRSGSAADVAIAVKELGIVKVLKRFGVLVDLEAMLVPPPHLGGMESLLPPLPPMPAGAAGVPGSGMVHVTSSVSLASMVSGNSDASGGTGTPVPSEISGATGATGGKLGGSFQPPNAREGALLILRGLCEVLGRRAEPYVVPLLPAILVEAGSSHPHVRDAAEDTCKTLISLASPTAVPKMICPTLFRAIRGSTQWRVKQCALDRLAQLATLGNTPPSKQTTTTPPTDPPQDPTSTPPPRGKPRTSAEHICTLLPQIIPMVTEQVWDTKPQVSSSAAACLLAVCHTNANPDVTPAIPAVVRALVKPTTKTMEAIEELMAATFVTQVEAPTLSILCPVLSRGLKEKNARHKRSTCVVIQNMCRLVSTPKDVAPFGPLLVPELRRVVENVQFEDIRDVALAALTTLTKALGHSSVDAALQATQALAAESKRLEGEQMRIEQERQAEIAKQQKMDQKEAEERKQWKEAMEAQRQLDKLEEEKLERERKEKEKKQEKNKQSVKGTGGKCKACGLKKCKKGCLFAG